MQEPLVTVLTAVRNGMPFLGETIASIRSQDFADWEYVIVDDASDDGTVDYVEEVIGSGERFRLIRRGESGGPYVAANHGLKIARGRYVARIDADDVAPPGRLARQIAFLEQHRQYRACGGFHRALTPDGVAEEVQSVPTAPGVLRWQLGLGRAPLHSTAFVERAAFEELGGYRELRVAQDRRLWCELSVRGWLGIVPEVLAHRRVHEQRLTEEVGTLQRRLAAEASRDHLAALSGQDWSVEEAEQLWAMAHGVPCDIASGLATLDRWAKAWRADDRLTREDRTELDLATWRLRRRHLLRGMRAVSPRDRARALVRLGRDKLRSAWRPRAIGSR